MMGYINIHEAKSRLSQLIAAIETGEQSEITIARNGKPAARLVALAQPRQRLRIGLAKGKFILPDDFDADNDEIAALFNKPAEW